MPTDFHNPKKEIEQLYTILSNPAKKIGFLFGAGVSIKYKDNTTNLIPGIEVMTENVVNKITEESYKRAITEIKTEIEEASKKFNVETLLSKISEKERAAGQEKLCGLNSEELKKLREGIEKNIKDMVSVHMILKSGSDPSEYENIDIEKTSHSSLAKWIRNADRNFPVEIFTTNYDYLFELALEKEKIPYFDGFVGSYEAFFCSEWIEPSSPVKDWVKLWKLHGSLGWSQKEKEIIRTSGDSGKAMIYPSYLKYDHSKKQPYLSYMERLSGFLRQEDAVLFVCGYSFGDEHINEVILTSLARSRSSNVFIFKNGTLEPEDTLCKEIATKNSKISVYAKTNAVIGCKLGAWKLISKEDEAKYFKEKFLKEDPSWNGEGEFQLGNFSNLTNFLSEFYKKNND